MDLKQTLEDIIHAYAKKDITALKKFIAQGHCKIENKKLVFTDEILKFRNELYEYWDQQQYIRKILLNSLYGALLNEYMRFYDQRIGQSTTLNGRNITKHMTAKINEVVTGEYDPTGPVVIYGDTDSVSPDTLVHTNAGVQTIEQLFNSARIKWSDGDKEYAADDRLGVLSLVNQNAILGEFDYVYRHKTKKKKYRVTDSAGNSVIVTEDHSVMVIDDEGNLVERKPTEIAIGDKVLSL